MASTEELERDLANDLQTIGDLVHDDSFYPELYRGLAGVSWQRADEGHISLSWKRAEEVVNLLRAEHGHAPLELAQTGGEGDVSARVADALSGLGWTPHALDTHHRDPGHIDSHN
jgi:hypothetical protein